MKTLRKSLLALAIIVPLALFRSHEGAAEEPNQCDAPHELDKYKLLRRISLDIRHKLPTIEEYTALDKENAVPNELVASFIGSDDFRLAMRRHHENMFWPNVSNVRISDGTTQLGLRMGTYALPLRENVYRGARDVSCDNVLQTEFDPAFPGQFRPVPRVEGALRHDGYRMVAPYWAPTTQIKVCAYEAQETLSVPGPGGKTYNCNTVEGRGNRACGCGPDLKFCFSTFSAQAILTSMREQAGRVVDRVTTGKAPYTDLVLTTDAEENGPLSFFRRNLATSANLNVTYNAPLPDEKLSDLPYTEARFLPVAREPLHAGVLTTPAFLLRFQTDRGRANRFRVAFAGQYFVPAAKLEPQAGCSSDADDLTKRCNCQYCHQVLEPLSAHFGGFAESGSGLLSDRKAFPLQRPDCIGSNDRTCRRFYVTDRTADRAGWLLSYQYADVHSEYATNIEKGPRKLAESIIADGTFARTAVRYLFERLMKRPARTEGVENEDAALIDALAGDFAQGGYNYPRLAEKIVGLPEYRRAR
jgi:hypothetical protein